MVNVVINCSNCHKAVMIKVQPEDLGEWKGRKDDSGNKLRKIQDIFPYLTDSEREMFLSGMCDDCWKEIFPNEDDEDFANADL